MKKMYHVINPECLIKMLRCFSGKEELEIFMNHLAVVVDDMWVQFQLIKRFDEDASISIIMKQICGLSIFIREHMELIQQLISHVDSNIVTEELNERDN